MDSEKLKYLAELATVVKHLDTLSSNRSIVDKHTVKAVGQMVGSLNKEFLRSCLEGANVSPVVDSSSSLSVAVKGTLAASKVDISNKGIKVAAAPKEDARQLSFKFDEKSKAVLIDEGDEDSFDDDLKMVVAKAPVKVPTDKPKVKKPGGFRRSNAED